MSASSPRVCAPDGPAGSRGLPVTAGHCPGGTDLIIGPGFGKPGTSCCEPSLIGTSPCLIVPLAATIHAALYAVAPPANAATAPLTFFSGPGKYGLSLGS